MMKKLVPVSVIILLWMPIIVTAQTWAGMQDSNWSNPADWSTCTVSSPASASGSNALPVVYFSFSVRLQPGGTVLLNWQADEMTEHEYFEIQRSTDGSSWQTIGIVQPNITKLYSFVDRQPLPSINYYRLKNVDNTGFCTFSPVKVVALRTGAAVAMWPNPVIDELHLQIPSAPATVRLVDAAGNVVRSARLNQTITIISFKGLQPGLYVLQVQSAGKIHSVKVIKY